MMVIKGGTYNGNNYSCMYEANNIEIDATKDDLIGIIGMNNETGVESMLWFREHIGQGLEFVSADEPEREIELDELEL